MVFIIQVYTADDNEWIDVAMENNAAWAIRRAKNFEKQYDRVRVVKRKDRPFINEGELDGTSFE
jgi:hypothetical protein